MSTYSPDCPVEAQCRLIPDKICLITEGQKLSYREIDNYIHFLAERLKILDLSPGSRIAVLSEHSPHLIALIFAAFREGVTLAILSPRDSKDECLKKLDILRADKILSIGDVPSELKSACSKLYPKQIYDFKASINLDYPKFQVKSPCWSDGNSRTGRAYLVMFTSGSKGVPKAVALSADNLICAAKAHNERTQLISDDCWLMSIPMFHVGGVAIAFRVFLAGASLYFSRQPNVSGITEAISAITHVSMVPTVLQQCLDSGLVHDLLKLRMILLGGAPVPAQLLERALRTEGLSIAVAYGMTELSSSVCIAKREDLLANPLSSGRPISGIEIRIAQSDDMCAEGEIEVKGPQVFSAYLENGVINKRHGLWFQTGDKGYFEQHGQLVVSGRADDMFISGGENIHCSEIEQIVLDCSVVKDASVLAKEHPLWGKRPHLYVVFEKGVSETLGLESLKHHLEKYCSKLKRPDSIHVVALIPRTELGKVRQPSG